MNPFPEETSAEDSQQQQQPQPTPQDTSADVIRETAETAQEKEKEEGVFTRIGEFVANAFDPDSQDQQGLDITKQIYEGLGGEVDEEKFQEAKDLLPTQEETEAKMAEIPVIGKPMVAISGGFQDGMGLAFGTTLAANLANEEATWDNRPEVIKDDKVSEALYDIAKIMTPTLLYRGFGLGLGMSIPATRAVETMLEVQSIDSADDLMGGRTAAEAFGKLYAEMTGDQEAGNQFTRDLIEGDKAAVQPFLKTWAFLQLYGINAAGERVFGLLGPAFKKLWENIADVRVPVDDIAKASGKTRAEVIQELGDLKETPYNAVSEPDEVVTANTIGLNPSANNDVNESALLKKLMAETNGEGLDPEDPANYFYNWGALSTDPEGIKQLQAAFVGKVPLEAGSVARARIAVKSARFILDYMRQGQGKDEMLQSLIEKTDMLDAAAAKAVNNPRAAKELLQQQVDLEEYFEKNMSLPATENGLVGIAVMRYMAEQGGLQLKNVAEQIALRRDKGLPYDDLVNNVLIPNQRFLRTVLSPLRKAKRFFFLSGEAQQTEMYNDIQRLLGEEPTPVRQTFDPKKEAEDIKRKKDGLKVDGKRITITDIEGAEDGIAIDTLEQVWGLVGDSQQAREIFELAMDNIRFGDPGKTIENLNLTSDIIKASIKNKQAFTKYFYNVVALGQFGTQANAVGATLFRQSLEPLALIVAGVNPFVRSADFKDAIYGMGMFIGGLRHIKASFKAGWDGYKYNRPASGNSRYFGANYTSNLEREYNEIKELHWRDYQNRLKEGENPMVSYVRWIGDKSRELAYTKGMNLPTRLLMASDEAAKVTNGAQHAYGRALVNLFERKEWRPEQMLAQIKLEEEKIFKGPIWKGEITDASVKRAGERVTFQEPFQKEMDPNVVEGYFKVQDAGKTQNPIQLIFNAFPRIAYRSIEQEYVENVVGSMPSPIRNRLSRKLKGIYNDPDPTIRLQLEGQKSLAQLVMFSTFMGTMISTTAAVKDALGVELPEINVVGDRLIVEGEDFDYAIESGKFSPAQILMAIMGNANEAFFTGKTSEQDWASKMGMLAVLTLEDILDRNVLQGQQKFSRIVDVGSPSWGKRAFGFLWDFVSPGLVREIASVVYPYETIQDVRTTRAQEILGEGARQGFASAQNPGMFDFYAPEKREYPKPRVPTLSKDPNPWEARLAAAGAIMFPGRITAERFNDPVFTMFRKSGFELKPSFIRTIGTAELDAKQQSILSQALQGPLYQELARFEKKEYPKLMKKYKEIVKKQGAQSDVAQAFMREKITSRITQIHYQVKDTVIKRTPQLINDPRIQEALERKEEFNRSISSRQGMYQTAANQSTELASQVRNILDIPV